LTDYQLVKVRDIHRKFEDQVDKLRNHLEELTLISGDEWKKIDKKIDELYITLNNLRDEIY